MSTGISYKYIFLLSVFPFLGTAASAQGFEGEDAYAPDSVYAVRNAIKIDPLQIIFGDYSIYYERIISDRYSAEAGIGITRRNYAASWYDYTLDDFGRNVDIQTSHALSASLRRYFMASEELFGPYFAIGASLRDYRTHYTVIDSLGDLTDRDFDDRRQSIFYSLSFGYQAIPLSSNLFVDFYVALGLRSKDFLIVRALDRNDPETYSVEPLNENRFGVQVGAKIGFGF